MPTYFDLLPMELNDMIWKQVHHLRMLDLRVDLEMHYTYRRNCVCCSVSIAAMLCKDAWRQHELELML